MKRKKYICLLSLFVFVFLIGNCALSYGRNYHPYSNISPTKVQAQKLIEYNDCFGALNAILTDEVKERFLELDSIMAPIEICQAIGGFFITNWKLNRYGETRGTTADRSLQSRLPHKPENVPSRFIYDGVREPDAMIRIIFTCYYKFLKRQEYSWENEIEKLKSYWIQPTTVLYYTRLPDNIEIREDSIINNYYCRQMKINDYVVCLLRQPPKVFSKQPSWFYLTGMIQDKNEECQQINIKIVKIETEFNKQSIESKSDTLSVRDVITGRPRDWHLFKLNYFDYLNNRYYSPFRNPMKER